MEPQAITDEERVDRIAQRLMDKAMEPNRPPGPLLGPEGWLAREFFDDMRELPPRLVLEIEEYAACLETLLDSGVLFIGEPRLRVGTDGPVAAKKIQQETKAAGLSWATVRRAKDAREE